MTDVQVAIIGGGPAGLTAAYELASHGVKPLVLERGDKVGGIARTESYKGYRFDIGGHRFFTKVQEVQDLWLKVMGDDFISVPRLSRIFYKGRYYDYPLKPFNVIRNLGLLESALIIGSYVQWMLRPSPVEDTFEQWVQNRFGDRLYRTFFKTYTEKVWGIPCSEIRADWAAQRIKGLSFISAVKNALFGGNETKSLINEFQYPRLGPGMMWEKFTDQVEQMGGEVRMHTDVVRINRQGPRVTSIVARQGGQGGQTQEIRADHFITSMPITALLMSMSPPPPDEVLAAARGLKYRDFLIVTLILKRDDLFPDNWIYVHTPEVKVGRIQNFKNWSAAMVPEAGKTCVGMEYFCSEGDAVWETSDAELIKLAAREIERLKLANASDAEDGCVIREKKAYPVYDGEYRAHLDVLRRYLDGFENLQTVGRNGMHRYNNQDHSMLTALLAARNILGERHDLWEVNVERSYHEEQQVKKDAEASAGPAPFRGGAVKPVSPSRPMAAALSGSVAVAAALGGAVEGPGGSGLSDDNRSSMAAQRA